MPFTYEDLLLIPEDIRCEIFNGELRYNRSRTVRHQAVLGAIAFALCEYVEANQTGVVLVGPVDVVLAPEWVLTPDILYVSNVRKSILTERNISGPPDLTVEVLDDWTLERDEIIKREAYEKFGVNEYWIIDPELESIKVYRRNATNRYDRVVELSTETEGARFISPLFPDLEIPLAEIFAE